MQTQAELAAGRMLSNMEIRLLIPDDVIDQIIGALNAKADMLAAEKAELIVSGNRWVGMKEARAITGRSGVSIRAAIKMRQLASYMNKGKPQFKVRDLEVWMDQTRREAKLVN